MFSRFRGFNSLSPWSRYGSPRQNSYQSPQQYRQQYEPQMRYQRPMGYYQSRYGQPQGQQYGGGGQPQYGRSMMNPYQNRLAMMSQLRNYDQGRRNQYANAAAQNRLRQETWNKFRPPQSTGSSGGGWKEEAKNVLMPGRRILKKLF